jgi:hypothetical protein
MRVALLAIVILVCVALSCDWFEDPVQENLPPNTHFTGCATGEILEGDDVIVTWEGNDIDGTVTSFEWLYDDGDWVMTTASSVTIEQVTLGEHVIRVRSTDDDGAADPNPAECAFNVTAGGELVDRVVLVELLTATWCLYCPNSEEALLRLIDEFGPANLCVVAYHDTPELDDLATNETVSRINWYTGDPEFPMDPGVRPTVVFDGVRFSQGAVSVEEAQTEYRFEITSRRQTGSAISLKLEGDLGSETGHLTVTVKAEDRLPVNPIVLRFVIVEDDVFSLGRSSNWFDFVARDLLESEVLELASVGDSTVVERQFPIEDFWELDKLDAIVFVQDAIEKEVIQAARLRTD